jgi:hypothetical protein
MDENTDGGRGRGRLVQRAGVSKLALGMDEKTDLLPGCECWAKEEIRGLSKFALYMNEDN